MIFSRRRTGRHARDGRAGGPLERPGRYDDVEVTDEDDLNAGREPERGPYDSAVAPSGVQRLDLGSLQIPAVEGIEVRVQAGQDGTIGQVVLVHGDSALQLAVVAAPRSEGIWDEVREDLRTSLSSQGATVAENEGEYGIELRARVPRPEGLTNLRFVGIDGPRWMVQGSFHGPAATDPQADGPLAECLRGLVVVRGQEAKPVREPLPLRLPRQVAGRAVGESD